MCCIGNEIVTLPIADPNPSNCDAECGTLALESVNQHVLCRLECLPYDFIGLALA